MPKFCTVTLNSHIQLPQTTGHSPSGPLLLELEVAQGIKVRALSALARQDHRGLGFIIGWICVLIGAARRRRRHDLHLVLRLAAQRPRARFFGSFMMTFKFTASFGSNATGHLSQEKVGAEPVQLHDAGEKVAVAPAGIVSSTLMRPL